MQMGVAGVSEWLRSNTRVAVAQIIPDRLGIKIHRDEAVAAPGRMRPSLDPAPLRHEGDGVAQIPISEGGQPVYSELTVAESDVVQRKVMALAAAPEIIGLAACEFDILGGKPTPVSWRARYRRRG